MGQCFESSEKEFQYQKLVHHHRDEEADHLLSLEASIEVKQEAKNAMAKVELDPMWEEKEESIMLDICCYKYRVCPHAREALLESQSEIAEATADQKWGTSFDVDRTLECLPDFWPGQNLMGKILKIIRTELLEEKRLQQIENDKKRKQSSPL